MQIRRATRDDVEHLARMRSSLWPSGTYAQHEQEVAAALGSVNAEKVILIAVDAAGGICGFAEASLRRDYVNGCNTSPVAFLEGIYVTPDHRGSGVGRSLSSGAEDWGRHKGCKEFASDALIENGESHAFHAALGFEETERVVYFRKTL